MFKLIHGYDPFPWQSNAARQMLSDKNGSLTIKVPTAAGKTALIDAAVYAAAHGGPKRIIFIIDRRVVVDEAYARAKRIADALQEDELESLSQKTGPIKVVRLRGGVQGDDEWILYPECTTIIVSTVDQIGSRLLHRGYGVSSRMAPMHAGFVGKDAIYIIDEAHLSVPFIETVRACRQYGADIKITTMTATPVLKADQIIELTDKDWDNPLLLKRLKASKKASLVSVDSSENAFVKQVVGAASQMSESIQLVGVMVNRVATARAVWQGLLKNKGKNKTEAVLLIGRNRPHNRDRLMEKIFPEVRAGRSRGGKFKMVVVSTQTLEVGADIDFDGLITEAASLDALRQRFGRLDRLGELGLTHGIIFYRQDKKAEGIPNPDPIYGMSIHETWQWLNAVAENDCIDFGVAAMEMAMRKLAPPAGILTHAPVLLPTHMKLLSQTGPFAPRIAIASWLHGVQKASSDVSIVWRADLDPDDLGQFEAIKLRPPLTDEALAMPIYAVRAWLQGKRAKDVTDLEGVSISDPFSDSQKSVVRWRGLDDIEIINPSGIAPGDTIIVPSAYGGCDEFGWSPEDKTPVKDIADYSSLKRQRNHTIRLVPGLTDWLKDKEPLVLDVVKEIKSRRL